MIDLGRIIHKHAQSSIAKTCFLGLVLFILPLMVCQGQMLLKYQVEDLLSQKGELSFPDSVARENYLQDLLLSVQLEGYPTAYILSKTFIGDTLDVRMEAGQLFNWLLLRKGNLDDRLATRAGYEDADFRNRPLNFPKLRLFFE